MIADDARTRRPARYAADVGRWWVVVPGFAASLAVAIWLEHRWQPSVAVQLWAIVPAIIVIFPTGMLFNHVGGHRELRTIGMAMLFVGLGVMSVDGMLMAAGYLADQAGRDKLVFTCHACLVGLGWMLLYSCCVAVTAVRRFATRAAPD